MNSLSDSGTGSVTIWVEYMGLVGGNVQEAGGGAHRVPRTG